MNKTRTPIRTPTTTTRTTTTTPTTQRNVTPARRSSMRLSVRFGLFGSPLEAVINKQQQNGFNSTIPFLVRTCQLFIRKCGMIEGIFKPHPSIDKEQLRSLRLQFEKAYDTGEQLELPPSTNPHLVAACLRLYLQYLPESLLALPENYSSLMHAADVEDPNRAIESVVDIVEKLPQRNKQFTRTFVSFLRLVASTAATKMSPSLLAAIFGPCLLEARISADKPRIIRATKALICRYGCSNSPQQQSGHDSSPKITLAIPHQFLPSNREQTTESSQNLTSLVEALSRARQIATQEQATTRDLRTKLQKEQERVKSLEGRITELSGQVQRARSEIREKETQLFRLRCENERRDSEEIRVITETNSQQLKALQKQLEVAKKREINQPSVSTFHTLSGQLSSALRDVEEKNKLAERLSSAKDASDTEAKNMRERLSSCEEKYRKTANIVEQQQKMIQVLRHELDNKESTISSVGRGRTSPRGISSPLQSRARQVGSPRTRQTGSPLVKRKTWTSQSSTEASYSKPPGIGKQLEFGRGIPLVGMGTPPTQTGRGIPFVGRMGTPPTPTGNKRRLSIPAPPRHSPPPPPAVVGKNLTKIRLSSVEAATKIAACVRGWLERRRWQEIGTTRRSVVFELLSTEKSYAQSLEAITRIYNPFQSALESGKPVISSEQINAIFGNVHEILSYSQQLVISLENRLRRWNRTTEIGAILLHFFQQDKVNKAYTRFVTNYKTALSTLAVVKGAGKGKAKQMMQDLEKKNCGRNLLQSYLIFPVQRIPRYVLLLKEVIKLTHASHPDLQNLKACLETTQELCFMCNDEQRRCDLDQERFQQLQELHKLIQPKLKDFVNFYHYVVREGDLRYLDIKEIKGFSPAIKPVHFILLTDCFLLTKPREKKKIVLKNRIELRTARAKDLEDGTKIGKFLLTNAWEFQGGTTSLIFFCSSANEKNELLSLVTRLIDHLKLNRSMTWGS